MHVLPHRRWRNAAIWHYWRSDCAGEVATIDHAPAFNTRDTTRSACRSTSFQTILMPLCAGLSRFIILTAFLTVPHKVRAIAYVDRISTARIADWRRQRRETRTGQSWIGDMFDGLGLVGADSTSGVRCEGQACDRHGRRRCRHAIVDAIAEAGAASIVVFDLDQSKATDITARLGKAHSGCRITAGAPMCKTRSACQCNAGRHGARRRHARRIRPIRSDVYSSRTLSPMPEITPLLAHARKCGCCISTGMHMYNAQVDMIVQFLVPENRSNAFPRWPTGLNAAQKR